MLTENKRDERIAAIHKVRVNIKSLAAEARFIRHEARKAGTEYRGELDYHRRTRLRDEARYAQLVIAFLRGRPYRAVELKASVPVSPARLVAKLKRYLWGLNESDATIKITEWIGK